MLKETRFNKEARDKLLSGVKKITDAVRVTMGANGKCVLIGESIFHDGLMPLPTIVTKDGYTVTKHFQLPDMAENRGALMIKEAALKTVMQAGDATTCTCVLAEAILAEGMKLVDAGGNSQEIKRGIENAVEQAVKALTEMSTQIRDDNEKIFQVASVSANNDPAIGRMIADAFKKIGPEGVIDIEAAISPETEIKISDGYKFDRSWITPLFMNNKEKQVCEFNDALILLYDKRITHHTQVFRALEIANNQGRQLLVVCEDAADEGLAFLATNVYQKRARVCVVKAPAYGEERRIEMEDLALLTGATFIGDVRGVSIKEFEPEYFGSAKKVVVNKDETVIIGGGGDKEKLQDMLNELRMNLAQAKNEDEKAPIEKRIARLTGGVAVIQVGAATETEMKEKLDRFDDAVRATKAAIAEGFVAGGGTAFVRVANKINIDDDRSLDFCNGQLLIMGALESPVRQMAANAGQNPQQIYDAVSVVNGDIGYNTASGQVEDLVKAGIIDSTKALRCALINAASVASLLLITECHIEQIG
jgi:chaperonin GroEL